MADFNKTPLGMQNIKVGDLIRLKGVGWYEVVVGVHPNNELPIHIEVEEDGYGAAYALSSIKCIRRPGKTEAITEANYSEIEEARRVALSWALSNKITIEEM